MSNIGLTPIEQMELQNKQRQPRGGAGDDDEDIQLAPEAEEKVQDFEEDDDYDYGENDEPENVQERMQEMKRKKDRCEDDILFNIQGIGAVKKINGYDVFVKNKDCETSLNYLYKSIKNESNFDPWAKQILGEWKFL